MIRSVRQNILPLVACLLLASLLTPVVGQVLPGQLTNTIPSQAYYQAIEDLYRGEYRDALRTLNREARGSVRLGVTERWIDSICYHAMWGEVLYQAGQPALALEQFDQACSMYLVDPKWLLQVRFNSDPRPDTSLARKVVPWGTSTRQFILGDVPEQMSIQMGDDYATQSQVAQQGGVLRQLQMWQIDVVEIVRATALAIRRRNEILGPLAAHDPISRDMVNKLSSGIAPPNHWSNAWADLLLGIAYAGQGNLDQANSLLQRSERLAGRLDHPLTCVALLEQGRLAMEAGKTDLADQLLAEASYSAFYYEDAGVIDEAFRLASQNRLASHNPVPIPALDNAAAWARRERFAHIFARLSFARAEEWMNAGNWRQAASVLQTGQSQLGDARTGLLGNWSQYLEARVLAELGKPTAISVLESALANQIGMSNRTLQLQLTDRWFDQQQLRASSANEVYNQLLSDPQKADWALRPLETMALMKTPLDGSFDRWLVALQERKDRHGALEVTDLAKRRRYYNSLMLGGRLAALRETLETPTITLTPAERTLRDDLLLRYPDYRDIHLKGKQIQSQLRAEWKPEMSKDDQQELGKLWKKWSDNLAEREGMLGRTSLTRVSSQYGFPQFVTAEQLQGLLQPGQAVVVFHETGGGLLGFLITDRASTSWNCGPNGAIARLLSQFLRDLGSNDRNSPLDEKQLESTAWLESGQALFHALFDGSSIDPDSMEELVVVPDGLVWYVPLHALPINLEGKVVPLTSLSRVRVVPTMGLAYGHAQPWRRVQHSSIVGDELVPGDKEETKAEVLEPLKTAMPNLIKLPDPSPVASPVLASLLEGLVVLDEFDIERTEPLAWSPIPNAREGHDGELAAWLALPIMGPQRLIFPGAHTIAENGGKTSRRRASQDMPGSELFLASCGLMSTGAQTILLSRWRVGGQSTLEIVREFVQELHRTSAADAWQRCIEVAKELQLEPALEPRVSSAVGDDPPTASFPFFWAGYILVDSGEPPTPAPIESAKADSPPAKPAPPKAIENDDK
ncbi:tetratricopeptide repeat protein [Bythopirellula polymerisocia]|uniref:CHAT domain protein n=1 Tax=Bythopirellula polymerisocia TaxID=2528003 RepID=A0A5C6CWU8_9BACT|nr:tetratricopeptide repeat protein [Bythopirellula polymerisocia]TWU29443.1 CHAT domain protein [Bythopirellula polymerisocia]